MNMARLPIKLHPDDPRVHYWNMEGFWECLECKRDLCQQLQSTTILEIGVYAGYSAQAFLLGAPQAHYIGLDCNDSEFWGDSRFTNWSKNVLSSYHTTILTDCNTQILSTLPIGDIQPDLFHVDGNSTPSGIFHDLELCLKHTHPKSQMLISCWDRHDIQNMMKNFFELHPEWHTKVLYDKVALITREQTELQCIYTE